MQKKILEDHPKAEISVIIVWLRMYNGDSLNVAHKASRFFSDDPRVIQFYDPEKISGLEIAVGLGAKPGEVAWDVYLFFDRQTDWVDRLPEPIEWVHQLSSSSWAERGRLYTGDHLEIKLREMAEKLLRD